MDLNPSNSLRGNSSNCHQEDYNPILLGPRIVGYMSVDATRSYRSDLSQLKFITDIPKGKISWDLNHNIDQAVKRTTGNSNEKIDLLLKILLDQGGRLHLPPETFITYRRTLINVMYSYYSISEPVGIKACLYKNQIYLCDIESERENQRSSSSTKQETFCAWGYKFEQYISSDQPTLAPNIDRPVVENEEFSLFYSYQLASHKLFYGAQIDGLLATSGTTTPPPKTTDVKEIINYLKNNQFAELKTQREIKTSKQSATFKRHKLFKCWCQCYLANLKGLVVGYRNDHGIVQRLQWFETASIPGYCKYQWDPQITQHFLNYFLTFVKNSLHSYSLENNGNNPVTLDFYIDVHREISVVKDNVNRLLPDWYLEKY